mmetsp:Transcript_9844/g.18526  ORF Transcript_9844/g.18526 Transcript_9844/m.18526 type:complete len:287 (-) Transcript_9844:223-1083(-)
MKINKSALAAFATVCSARAFSINSPRNGQKVIATAFPKSSFLISSSTRNNRNNSVHSISTSTALPMVFDKIFSSLGGSGGGYSNKIDYSAIPYPVPELASVAMEGNVPEEMERNGKVYKLATFAGGCFWGLELAYQRVPGVEYTAVGYTQGGEQEPTYGEVCAGATGHTEAVIVLYDPKECSYETLLDTFLGRVDPLTVNGQGNDRGRQYRTGVYYHSKEQEEIAKARFELEQKKYTTTKIASECLQAMPFWPAEKYHQQYLEKGGRFNSPQSAAKGCNDTIRCYG